MIRITNIGGLLSLIYLWYTCEQWSLHVNETNIISSVIVNIMQKLPLTLTLVSLITLYILVIKNNKGALTYILYFFSLILFQVLCTISMRTLMLENTTSFFLFNVTHPVPLQLKLYYVGDLIQNTVNTNPELLQQRIGSIDLQALLKDPTIIEKIRISNANEIKNYFYEHLNQYDKELAITNKQILQSAFMIFALVVIIEKLIAI